MFISNTRILDSTKVLTSTAHYCSDRGIRRILIVKGAGLWKMKQLLTVILTLKCFQ